MTAETAAFLFIAGVNIACAVISVRRAWRHIAAERQALQAAELLRDLCCQAYLMQHRPIWQAWADCMGAIRVRAQFIRHELEDDA